MAVTDATTHLVCTCPGCLSAPHHRLQRVRGILAAYAARLGSDVVILCAGTIGRESLEDTVCGGMIADALGGEQSPNASEARKLFLKHKDDILSCLRDSFHGQDLIKLGFAKDLEYTSQVDKTDVLPVLDENGTIVGKKFERGET